MDRYLRIAALAALYAVVVAALLFPVVQLKREIESIIEQGWKPPFDVFYKPPEVWGNPLAAAALLLLTLAAVTVVLREFAAQPAGLGGCEGN